MAKLVVSEFTTLDGVIEDPGGAEGVSYGGWAFQFDRGSEGDEFKLQELWPALRRCGSWTCGRPGRP